jgi:hypothetical protein
MELLYRACSNTRSNAFLESAVYDQNRQQTDEGRDAAAM